VTKRRESSSSPESRRFFPPRPILRTLGGWLKLLLVPLDTDPTKAIAWLGYFGGGLALWKLVSWAFDEAEKNLSKETKGSLASLLMRAKPSEVMRLWSNTWIDMFDGVFGKQHLSWSCFLKSAGASVLFLCFMIAVDFLSDGGFRAATHLFRFENGAIGFYLEVVSSALIANVFVDYVSLLETRFVLERIRNGNAIVCVPWLAVDFVVSGALFFIPWFVVSVTNGGTTTAIFFGTLLDENGQLPASVAISAIIQSMKLNTLLGPFVWSSYMTSVWVWIYAVALMMTSVLRSVEFVRKRLDVEGRPLGAVGFMAGSISAMIWWGLAIVIWLRRAV
jgi:hypothetical protein